MVLRNFLYLNEQMLNDYLAIFEGAVPSNVIKTEKETNTTANVKTGDVKFLKGETSKETEKQLETKIELEISAAAKFQKLFDNLKHVNFYDFVNEEIWNEIKRNEIIEVMGTIRFSKIKQLTKGIEDIERLVDMVEQIFPQKIASDEERRSISGIKKLNELQNGKEVACVVTLNDCAKYQFVCYLDEDWFRVNQENFVGDVTILCKVQKKVEKGQSIELNDLFKNIRNMPLNREQRRQIMDKSDMKTPKELSDIIKGPLFVVAPVAIYK